MISDVVHETRAVGAYVLLEATRRRTFTLMSLITIILLLLFAWSVRELDQALATVDDVPRLQVDARQFAATQLAGIAMFGIFFIGSVLGVLINHAAVRGDAEQGLLQQVVARPIGRTVLIATRVLVVGALCAGYVLIVYLGMALILTSVGTWEPGSLILPGAWLALAVLIVCALTVFASVFLPTSGAGILVFMLIGAGLGSGFVMQLSQSVGSDALDGVAGAATWLLPFERCYQAAIAAAAPKDAAVQLLSIGPLATGRAATGLLLPWIGAWLVVVIGIGSVVFGRRDL